MLEKIISVDLMEVTENGSVKVRTKTAIMDDGRQISTSFHRHIIFPGDNYNAEDARVKSVCSILHTEKVVASYKAAQKAAAKL
jgi:archaellum component FlaF (FlaF/FlaG flagellin family)